MDKFRILLADDDAVFCDLAGRMLGQKGYDVETAINSEQAKNILGKGEFDIMMLDLCFPEMQDGFALLEYVRQHYPQLVILMISGVGNTSDVVKAIKKGAMDFIEKPFELEHIIFRLEKLQNRLQMERHLKKLEHSAIGMVGVSPQMHKVFDDIIAAAKYDSPVLITGETGVGKELAAKAIHRLSPFSDKEFICINCASVPRDLFEAELFGYEKGAFTGAVSSFKGYFEFARNSSIFLDEVSQLPMQVQAKLLRVLSEGEVQRIGGKVEKMRARIISASNQDLHNAIDSGNFREDLYYRLNSIHIHIPPLRERREDIIPLAHHFLNDFCHRNQLLPKEISEDTANWLREQNWEGNAREIRSFMERAMIFSQGDFLETVDFNPFILDTEMPGDIPLNLRDSLKRYEAYIIRQQLEANNFNVSQTAKRLGMDKSNLSKKIHALGINIGS